MRERVKQKERYIGVNKNQPVKIREILVRIGIFVALALSVLFPAGSVEAADITGYPWKDATHIAQPPAADDITWGYATKAECDNKEGGSCSSNTVGGWYYEDPWNFDLRNCTSYIAWRVNKEFGVNIPSSWGSANTWATHATNAGYTVDTTPETGDIAQWDSTHVAFVEELIAQVDGSYKVRVSEYNQDLKGSPNSTRITRADHYIDINGTGKGLNGEVTTGGGSSFYGGSTTLGTYNPSNGYFYERNSNTSGVADASLQFGNTNWVPLSGDWDGNGSFTPGVYNPSTGWFYLRNSQTSGEADMSFQYGNIGWIPLAGDWNGNDYWSIGLYDPNTSTFYLRDYNSSGNANYVVQFGNNGWKPIAGDWDGNRTTTIGVYDPYNARFHMRNTNSTGPADYSLQFGNIGWMPLAGDWNGNSYWSIGAYNPNTATFYLRDYNTTGNADVTAQFGNAGWLPIVGDWDGK